MEAVIETKTIDQPKKKRIDELDMVKGAIILSVMMRHLNEILGLKATNPIFDSAFQWMMEFFMIVFFLLSGYVYKSKGTIGQQILKRVKQLLIPLFTAIFISSILYFIRYIVIEHQDLSWFFQKIGLNFLGFTNRSFFSPVEAGTNVMHYGVAPMWYIHQLFPAFIVFVLVKALGDKGSFGFRCLLAVVLLTIAYLFAMFDIQHTISDRFESPIPFCLVLINIFGFAGVMMIGSLLKEKNVFDLETFSPAVTISAAVISLVIVVSASIDYIPSDYALQYGRWGQYGIRSILQITIGGIALSYVLVFLGHYIKKIPPLKIIFAFVGKNSLYYLLYHLMIGEMLCYIGGFWYPVYSEPYPVEKFSYSNWIIVVAITLTLCTVLILVKNKVKQVIANKKAENNKVCA